MYWCTPWGCIVHWQLADITFHSRTFHSDGREHLKPPYTPSWIAQSDALDHPHPRRSNGATSSEAISANPALRDLKIHDSQRRQWRIQCGGQTLPHSPAISSLTFEPQRTYVLTQKQLRRDDRAHGRFVQSPIHGATWTSWLSWRQSLWELRRFTAIPLLHWMALWKNEIALMSQFPKVWPGSHVHYGTLSETQRYEHPRVQSASAPECSCQHVIW